MGGQFEIYDDPEIVIQTILQEMRATGAVDQEPSLIEDVLQRYRDGLISGSEAVAEVRRIADSRQDYH